MTWLALPLMLAATQPAAKPPLYQHITATVQIIAAEEIRFAETSAEKQKATSQNMMRQMRKRGAMPMVEFY